jgi:RNA polymerase sigma factor (sigma-70 family)
MKCTPNEVVAQWFAENHRLAYWMAWKWCQRLLDSQGRFMAEDELAEVVQDAVCRGYDRFTKRCAANVCGESDRKNWMCQCMIYAARDAVRTKSSFGSVSDSVAIRDDLMNRRARVNLESPRGDDEAQDALEQVPYQPVQPEIQRWEVQAVADRELPADLADACTLMATGLTQAQAGLLLGVTAHTIRNRLRAAQRHLG